VWNDYEAGQRDFFKENRERSYKALAATLATTMRAGAAALEAPIAGVGQALQELGILNKEDVEGALMDPGMAMLFPPAGFEGAALRATANARRAANLRVEIPAARAEAVIAEGEAGYFEARELTPENAAARVDAANEAGIPTPVPEQVAPDVHVLARRVNPPVFEQYDALEAAKGAHRTTIQTMAQAREALPEAVQAQEEIRTILGKVHGVEERLTKAARARLEAAQARLDAVLSQDTPEMAKARKALLSADIAQRDLVPEVASAYRQARDMTPPVTERVAAVAEEVSAGKPIEEIVEQPAPVDAITAEVAERVEPPQTPRAGAAPSGGIRPVQGTGPLRTRTLSEGIEAKAIEHELTQSFGDLPEYHQLSMADQAAQATAFVNASPEEAFAVAMGKKAAPRGVLPESVLVAVEKAAIAEGDVETLRQLATESRLTTAATTMGQRIRTLGERHPSSPVGAIAAVQEARFVALNKRNATAIKDASSEIKAEMRRNAPSRDAWAAFIQEITCKP
jgi:hypothetical protein